MFKKKLKVGEMIVDEMNIRRNEQSTKPTTKWMRRNDRRRSDRRRNEQSTKWSSTKWMRRNECDEMIVDEMIGHPDTRCLEMQHSSRSWWHAKNSKCLAISLLCNCACTRM